MVTVGGYEWRATQAHPQGFYRVQASQLSTNTVYGATVLNRLAYGPTPDDLERVMTGQGAIGPEAYIFEQLSPELIVEDVANMHTNINWLEGKFASQDTLVTTNHASITDLRAWFTLRAVGARRQLLEVLLQFCENHFVTQYGKSFQFFDTYYDDSALQNRLATQLEYVEIEKWRTALLNPACTFYDLLRISVESPAMIIYLDTVSSRGDGTRIANENYARELLELFTFGVDNGYDQTDIVEVSKCWTGWTVSKMDLTNAFNPFATPQSGALSNTVGSWVFRYNSAWHNTGIKRVFTNKFVPARFGAPYTTKSYGTNTVPLLYELIIPSRSGTKTIQDGYEVIQHLANLPFTQEYISVKLCRLFVHDGFTHGYDFADPNLSPEGQLVRQCMNAWETSNGNLRAVLSAIFGSELFRSHSANAQKVKTPFEFVVSAIRALRTSVNGTYQAGTFTSDTDGYSLALPMQRMGNMLLFDRDDPDGYPEGAPGWISAGTIAERVRFVQSFCIAFGQNGHTGVQSGTGNDAGNTVCNPVELIKLKLPSSSWTSAEDVADYFLNIFYSSEGAGNLALMRQAAINYLNTNDQGDSSPFANLAVSSIAGTNYDTRVRGLVAMLLSQARFQEQ